MKKKKQQIDIPTPIVADDLHSKLITWVNESDEASAESRALSEKCMDYRDGKQWTDAEIAKLNKQKQAATVINRIKPKVDGLLGMEKTQRTTAKAFPRTAKHEKGAEAATEAIRFVLQDNFYNELRSDVFDNIIVPGTGGLEVMVKAKGEDYDIKLKSIPWDRIIYDPHSRRKDFSDARYLGQVVWMDYDEAIELYPDAEDVLEAMQTGSSTYDDKPRWMDNTRRRVKIVEMYWYEGKEIHYGCFTRGGWVKEPKVSPFKNEEGETEWPYEFASPFVGREGNRYGAVAQYLDVQDEINKRRSKALHLMSVRQIMLERGAVEDVNKARAELAKPDGVLEVTPGMEFELLKTGDMAAAQFNLLTEAKAEIDAVGYNAAVAGKDQNAISGVALRQRQQSGQTELAPIFDCLKHLDHRVYRKIWNRIKQYWKAEKWVRVTDDEQNLKWVGLNTPITKGQMMMEQAKEQGVPPEQLQQMMMQVQQDPMMQEVVDTQNLVAELDVDIVIDDAPDAITTQVEDFQVLGEMVKSGFQIPPEAVILASPLSHKDRILKMMKEQPQMSPEHQEQMKKMQEEMQKLQEENQKLQQNQQAEMMKLKLEAEKAQANLALEQQKAQADLELERAKAEAELQLEREKAAAEIELERAKVGAQVTVEREKAEAQAGLQKEKLDADISLQKTKIKGDHQLEGLKNGTIIQDPEEEEKKESERSAKEEQKMKDMMEAMHKVMHTSMQAFMQEMKKPRKRTATYKGNTIEVMEH